MKLTTYRQVFTLFFLIFAFLALLLFIAFGIPLRSALQHDFEADAILGVARVVARKKYGEPTKILKGEDVPLHPRYDGQTLIGSTASVVGTADCYVQDIRTGIFDRDPWTETLILEYDSTNKVVAIIDSMN